MITIPENLHPIGQVTKLHGFRGELTVFLDTSVPADYENIEGVFLEVKGELIPYRVELLEQKTKNAAKVKLAGVDNEALAKTLVKSRVFIERAKLTAADDMRRQLQDMEGFTVIDAEFGEVGKLLRILELSGNPQLEIAHEKGNVLLPLQENFILSIDHKQREIRVQAPPGLIELFISE